MTTKTREKNLEYYLSLKYPIQIFEEEGVYTAVHPDLPGSASFDESIEGAIAGLNENRKLWIEGRVAGGQVVPEPSSIEDYSGRLLLRMARSLHASLNREAQKEGVSLNQYITTVLAERHADRRTERLILAAISHDRDSSLPSSEEVVWHERTGVSLYRGESVSLANSGMYGVIRAKQIETTEGNVVRFVRPKEKYKGYA